MDGIVCRNGGVNNVSVLVHSWPVCGEYCGDDCSASGAVYGPGNRVESSHAYGGILLYDGVAWVPALRDEEKSH